LIPHSGDAGLVPHDARLLRIPRGPVLDLDTKGIPASDNWPRVDLQGRRCFTVSGRTAILHGLRQLGVGRGDRVLVPTYHCPTMIEPVQLLGAEPLFYPITAEGCADLDHLRQADLGNAKAMLCPHFFGLPLDMASVRAFCDERGMLMIEDCAHAYFGRSAVAALGSLGDVAIASLPKFFPVVEGGCLVSRRAALPPLRAPGLLHELRTAWDSLELSAASGRLGWLGAAVRGLARLKNRLRHRSDKPVTDTPASEDSVSPYRTIDLDRAEQRAARFAEWVTTHADVHRIASARRRNYRRFAAAFEGTVRVRALFPNLPAGAVPYVFPLWVDEPARAYQAVRRLGVPLYRWDIVWPGTPALPGDAGTAWSTHVFQLVCHQDMTEEDIDLVAAAVHRQCAEGER
jgi:perosamine synthetase